MGKDLKTDRAWIEINLDNLKNNINEIKKAIPSNCNIMAVVKANAYGHGIIQISKYLNKIGVFNFAVATLEEGITLRKNLVKGNILILGYTHFNNIENVIKYDLIQTIVDYNYAKIINNLNLENKIRVHVGINTGMNRIGESYQNIYNIIKIYKMSNLKIEGIYTHLCASDSNKSQDVQFTNKQISNFYKVIEQIKKYGFCTGKIHIQSSYGILNYSNLKCDYVRAGIIMYGVYSSKKDEVKIKLNLKPMLSVKARITSIKEIKNGDTVGYGRTFKANRNTKIATVSIGYADGYPRNLSNKNVKVKINDEYVKVIGRICMDQLLIDISKAQNVKVGDVVTLIGKEKEISVEEISNKSATITNELLSRLGERLERI